MKTIGTQAARGGRRRLWPVAVYLIICATVWCGLSGVAHGQARTGTGALPLPAVSAVTTSSFTLAWTTSASLNTQVWYGPHAATPNLSQRVSVWTLATSHSITVTGLTAGTTYDVQVESSYYSNPDLVSPVFTVTTAAGTASTLSLQPATVTLQPGQTQQFTASYSNGGTPTSLTWTASNGGQVSTTGLFTASAVGTYVVTATDGNGASATATVSVPAPPSNALGLPTVTSITTTSFTVSWVTTQVLNTQVHYGVQGSSSTTTYANWSLVTNHSAIISGLQPATTYTVSVESAYFSNPDLISPSFTVTTASGPPPAPSLNLSPATSTLQVGQIETFTATYTDGSAATSLAWSANNGGQISSAGVFSATVAGDFTITATDAQGNSGTATVTVQALTGSGLPIPTVSPITATSFTLTWQTAQALNTQVHYSLQGSTTTSNYANWSLVTSHTAVITGLQPGATYTVVAESAYFSNPDLVSPTFSVSLSAAAQNLALTPATVTLQPGQTQQFTATFADGSAATNLTWSVNNGGSLSASGLFSATTVGSFSITAVDPSGDEWTASAMVTSAPAAGSLVIAPVDVVLIAGAQQDFTAANSDGSAATVTWSATNGGSISSSGVFDATTAGSYVLTATDASGNSATTTVLVEPPSAPPPAASCPGCFFTSPQSAWLYAGSTPAWGTGRDLSVLDANWNAPGFTSNASGYGMPVQHTQELDGFTSINDANYYGRTGSASVPNPPNDQWTPSCGWMPPNTFGGTSCYGDYDGKDFIIDDTNGNFYEVDQLYVNSSGQPINYGPYANGTGPCGASGEAACGVVGIFTGNLATSAPNLGGSTAAGIVSGAGDIMPGELSCTTCLNHMVELAASISLVNSTTCNAFPTGKSGDGTGTLPQAMLCEGGILQYTGDWTQLDPATHSVATIALARALELYGGMIVDRGGSSTGPPGFFFYSDYDSAPTLTGVGDLLRHLAVFYGTAQLVTSTASTPPATAPNVTAQASISDFGPQQVVNLTAQVTNDVNAQGVKWTISSGAPGTLATVDSLHATYTAPATAAAATPFTVTATTVAKPKKSATVNLTLHPVTITVTGSPLTPLYPLQGVQLTATLQYDTNQQGVTWRLSSGSQGAVASVDPDDGAYTTSATITAAGSATVTATSVLDPTVSAAPVTINYQPAATSYWQGLVQFENGLVLGNSKPYNLLATKFNGTTPIEWQPNMLIFKDTQTGTEIWRLSDDPSDTYIPGIVNRTPWNANGSYFLLGSNRNPTQNQYGSVGDWLYDARGGLRQAIAPFDPNRSPSWTQKLSLGNGYLPPDRIDPNIVYAVTYNDNNNGTWTSAHSFLYAIDLAKNAQGQRFQATAVAEIPNVTDPVTNVQSATVPREIRSQLADDDRILVNDQNPNSAPATTDSLGYPQFYLYDGTKTDATMTANASLDPQTLATSGTQDPLLTSYGINFNLANDVPCASGASDTNPAAPCHDVSAEWHLHDLGFERDPADHIGINYGPRGSVGEYVDFLVPSLYNGNNSTISILYPNGNQPYFSHPGVSDGDKMVVYEGADTQTSSNYGVWLWDVASGTAIREYEQNPFESGHSDWSGFDPNYFVFDAYPNNTQVGFNLYEGLASATANFPGTSKGDRMLVHYPPRDPSNTVDILYSPTQSPDATKVMFTIPDSFDPAANAHLTSYIAVSHRPFPPVLSVSSTSPVTLTWTPYLTAREVAGYHVYRASGAGATTGFTEISSGLVNATTFTDSTAQAGQTYTYAVTAEEYSGLESNQLSNLMQVTAGGSSSQVAAAGTTGWDTTAPAPPTALAVSSLATNVWKVTWTPSTSADVRYYDVYVSFGTAPQATQAYLVDSPPLGQSSYIYWQGDPSVDPVFGVTAMDRQDNQSSMACMAVVSSSNACPAP